jgi:hypothetical protein
MAKNAQYPGKVWPVVSEVLEVQREFCRVRSAGVGRGRDDLAPTGLNVILHPSQS